PGGGSAKPPRTPMKEPKKGRPRPRQSKGRSFHELLFDHEHADGAEHQAGQDRSAAETLEPVIEHAHLAELVKANCRGTGSRRPERAVHQGFAPGGEMWGER